MDRCHGWNRRATGPNCLDRAKMQGQGWKEWAGGEMAGPDRSSALARIARGGALLVLLTPEALASADVKKALAKSGIALVKSVALTTGYAEM